MDGRMTTKVAQWYFLDLQFLLQFNKILSENLNFNNVIKANTMKY